MKLLFFLLIILQPILIINHVVAQDRIEARKLLLDSLESELPDSKSDTNHVKLLTELSFYYNIVDTDIGLKYGFDGVKLANKLNWEQGVGACYNSIGINYKAKNDLENAKKYFEMALTINTKLNVKRELIFNYLNLGIVNAAESNNSIAIDYLKKGLAISKEEKNENYTARYVLALGGIHYNISKYPLSLKYYHEALLLNQIKTNKKQMAFILGRIGQIHLYLSNFDNALDYCSRALKLNIEVGNRYFEANNIGNIGIAYYDQSKYQKALEYYFKALEIYRDVKHKPGISVYLGNIGNVYKNLKNYNKASEYYKQAISINKELKRKDGLAHNYNDYGEMILNIYYEKNVNIKKKDSELFKLSKAELLNKSLEYLEKSNQLFLKLNFAVELSDNHNNLHKVYFEKGNFKESIIAHRKYKQTQDSIFSKTNRDKIASLEKKRVEDLNKLKLEKQEIIIAAQEKEKELIVFSASGGIFSIVLILGIIINQRRASDKLLYNVLPVSIAKRLKKKEHPISDYFTQASIVFIDIVGFTTMSQDIDPRNIVIELNNIFTKYDAIAKKYGLEKIKTIGDSYMAAAGIPEVQQDNTHRAAQMALEIKELMKDYHTSDGTKIEVRIGLDCGPVVAGVIGENKFIYDMWSDAVNTASRMESSGIAGEVHVSERFKEAVSEYKEFEYIERGEIEIKGKGKMKTFFMGEKETELV